MLVTLIVPCYNEEAVIFETWQRLNVVLSGLSNMDYEVIFVNDGSKDDTLQILKSIADEHPKAKIINLSRNFGHQPAVTAGINNSKGDIAIIIDSDLQDPPELIPEMIEMYQANACNCVYAVRKSRQGETWFKKITAKYFYKVINNLSETPIPLDTGDFRLIDRKIINEFNKLSENNKFIRGLVSWIGFKQIPFYYNRKERVAGESKYPLKKMLRFALNGVMYFSKKPLKICITIGFISTFIAGILFLYVLYGYFFSNKTVTGWSSITIIIIFFSGVNMISLGLVAQYIAHIFDEVKNRPEYIIDEKINFKS